MYPASTNRDNAGIPLVSDNGSARVPDIFDVMIRWKWLPILGLMIGLSVGYLIYCQQPPQYKATALVQVETPANEVPISMIESRIDTRSRSDEIVVATSSMVLNKAVEIGALTQHRKLAGMSAERIVSWLKNDKVLEVKLGTKESTSNIISISATTNDHELSKDLVKAVVSAYREFQSGKLSAYSKDAILALTSFDEKYSKNVASAKEELAKLRSNSQLLWVNGEPRDPVGERIIKINEVVNELDSKSKTLQAVLLQVEKAMEAKRSVDDCLRMIAIATNDNSLNSENAQAGATAILDRTRAIRSRVEVYEETVIAPVRNQLASEQEYYGESYPTVGFLKSKLAKLEKDLELKKANAEEEIAQLEEEYSIWRKEPMTAEGRLKIACGAIKEDLQRMSSERDTYVKEADSLREAAHQNQNIIGNYQFALKDLETLTEIAKQTGENLRKLSLGAEYGQKTVTELEMPTGASFVGPSLLKYLGLSGFAGVLVFACLAYLLELADRSYRNPDEISAELGMPIIGHLPVAAISRADRVDENIDSSVVTVHKNRSALSEAIRGIRTAVFFGSQQGTVKVIQVTSPIPGDGKSTVSSNLAVSIAQSGRRVCLVDCDFRRPRIGKVFGVKDEVGIVQAIAGRVTLDEAIQASSVENLSVLTCGRRPSNPAELLSSEAFGDVIADLREKFDYVIVDTPPMLVVSDPAIISAHVDGVVLTIRLRRNLRPIAARAAQMLHALNANLLGVVVNGIGAGGAGNGYGGYRYDNYSSGSNRKGYGSTGYGGYGYGSTYSYGGYYGSANVGTGYLEDVQRKPKEDAKSNG